MEYENNSQLELFSQVQKAPGQPKAGINYSVFFRHIRSYEKIILLIIGFVITGIVSFSLGIERGRRQSAWQGRQQLDLAAQKAQPIKTQKPQVNSVAIKNMPTIQPISIAQAIQGYTVQIASYQSKIEAQKEAEKLSKKGMVVLVLPKKTYTVLCVGNFSNKETAQSLLAQLRKRYHDCFIRRL